MVKIVILEEYLLDLVRLINLLESGTEITIVNQTHGVLIKNNLIASLNISIAITC